MRKPDSPKQQVIIEKLLKAGINSNHRVRSGKSALEIAESLGNYRATIPIRNYLFMVAVSQNRVALDRIRASKLGEMEIAIVGCDLAPPDFLVFGEQNAFEVEFCPNFLLRESKT